MQKTAYPEGTDELLKEYGLKRDQVTPVVFQKGESILEQGYPVPALYFVVSGTTRIQTYNSEGKLLSFGEAGKGATFGEMELLLEQENSCNTILVLSRTVCLALPFPQRGLSSAPMPPSPTGSGTTLPSYGGIGTTTTSPPSPRTP
ncbi:MAG: cyclic nucleotide-binding domain-containing protein [Oscillospiraceae bacterium]|nr:cyclic nucleotide-binding domain-containing protein [Oscillospiraceae bacterium]